MISVGYKTSPTGLGIRVKCEECGDIAKGRFCDFCDKLYFKGQKLRVREVRQKPKKEKPVYEDRICEDCKAIFKPTGRTILKCSPCNKKWNNRTPAEKWLAKKPHNNVMDSDHLSYSFFRKKYGVKNNVFRG